MPPKKKQYLFTLKNINIEKIKEKYSLNIFPTDIPKNVTKLIEISEKNDTLSFYNESKKMITCCVSMIDICNLQKIQGYRCWWDHHKLPEDTCPIGCPIKFVPDKLIKKYTSEISKNKYAIIEEIPKTYIKKIDSDLNDQELWIENNNHYLTEGVFCSFNCVQGYINENKKNPIYKNSQQLLYNLYKDIFNKEAERILPSPNFRMLKKYGGKLTIESYRESFNKIEYIDKDIVNMYSLSRIYEEKFIL